MRFGIIGAGSIGCYIGGRLLESGRDVTLVARPALRTAVAESGLKLSDCDGYARHLPFDPAAWLDSVASFADRDVVLVAVKSRDTAGVARELSGVLPPGTLILSLQNGMHNVSVLREGLSTCKVLGGMVPFNVVRRGPAAFHRGTSGTLLVESDAGGAEQALVEVFTQAGIPTASHARLRAAQWGKLLLNLNNAVNALSGLPLRQQLADRGYRRVLAALMTEALGVMRAAGVKPAASMKVPPEIVPHVLRMPDALFFRLARAMLKVDPEARSSMWEDLERRRPTEIDDLNGEIVRLARTVHVTAPKNERIVALIQEAEAAGLGSPGLQASALAKAIGLS